MDAVWIVGGPTSDDREDLRYSIRSLTRNAPWIDQVWIVGDVPAWVSDDARVIRLDPLPGKFDNQRQSLAVAVNTPGVADEVLICADDQYLLIPLDSPDVVHLGDTAAFIEKLLAEGANPRNTWLQAVQATAGWLGDSLCYEAHVPLPFNRRDLAALLDAYPTDQPLAWGMLYNVAGSRGPGREAENAKARTPQEHAGKTGPWLSGNPDTWPGPVRDHITTLFPEPSKYEARPPVQLDIQAITSQKIAVGLVENPCCHLLRAEAAKVPTGQAIVELGSFKGRTTGWLALGSHEGNGAPVYAIDPWDEADDLPDEYVAHAPSSVTQYNRTETREAFEQHLDDTGIRPLVTTIQATAADASALYEGPKVGLLFHDALHRADDVETDLRAWLPHLADHAVIVLHDAGDPRLGVEEGARRVLGRRTAWKTRELHRWPKQPDKRGFLVIHL